jgi:predicted cupin superfamily sugar epimerase
MGGGRVQHLVPAGAWQAAELLPDGTWALFGCTMAPGYTDACFEGGAVAALTATYPARAADIARLGIPD